MMNYIEEYFEAGESKKINIPKRVKKQYQQLIPIIEGKDSRWYYNDKLAQKPIDFAQKFCRQSKGEWRERPIEYLLWQKAAISAVYGIVERETEIRKFQRVLIEVGKKNGKTTMIAPIALYETARKGNEVYCAANALPQASIIWTEACNMLKQSTQLKQILRPMQYVIKNIRPNGFSKFMPLANSPNILDGKLPHVVILDEIHELQQALYNILYDGQISLRDPLLFMLTTRGYVREGLFDSEYEDSCKIIDGVYSDDRKFSLLYELDNPSDWLNEENWIQANPSLGYILQVEALRDKVASEINKPKSLNSFKTKQFNIGGISGDAYFEFDTINNTRTFNIEKFRRYHAIGGFDLSLTNDLTAFTTLIWDENEGEYCVDVMFWISEDFYIKALQNKKMCDTWRVWIEEGYVTIAGKNSIDYSKIVDYAIFMAERYEIIYKYIYYDAYSARYLVNAFDSAGFREGTCLNRCRQGSQTLSVPFQQLDADLRAKKINYNNNPIMKWCLTNVAVEEDTRNKNLLPCKAGHNEMRKIDGFATLLDAYVGLIEHYSEFVN